MENQIATLRKARNWTQQELAARLSVSRQTIISLEKGRYDPSLRLAHDLAVAFHCTIEDIFCFDKEATS